METYTAELASYQVSAGTLGEIEKHSLPGIEALTVPGSISVRIYLLNLSWADQHVFNRVRFG